MTNLGQHIQHLRRERHQIFETQVRSGTAWTNLQNKKNERMRWKKREDGDKRSTVGAESCYVVLSTQK
jgi:hypothetical protein